jgi:hypothetical protein
MMISLVKIKEFYHLFGDSAIKQPITPRQKERIVARL